MRAAPTHAGSEARRTASAASSIRGSNDLSSANKTTLYLTELDVTRLERIAERAGSAQLSDMLDALLERAAIVAPKPSRTTW